MNLKINETDIYLNNKNEIIKDLSIHIEGPVLLSPNFIKEIAEFNVIKYISSILNSKKTFIDIGSHIGFYSIMLLNDFQQIYSFEPSKFQFEYLKKNIQINSKSNITISQKAVGSDNCHLEMNVMGRSGGTNTLVKSIAIAGDPMESYLVEVITIDSQKYSNVDFIKIDVEGFELEVLNGALNTINRDKPLILCEVWDNKDSREKIINFMSEINYNIDFIFPEFPELAVCRFNSNKF